jgi:hypothetical protein
MGLLYNMGHLSVSLTALRADVYLDAFVGARGTLKVVFLALIKYSKRLNLLG